MHTGADRPPRRVHGRAITGMSAILLPFSSDGVVDWPAFDAHVERTVAAGLTPAVNMDTGYVQLLDAATRITVLERTAALANGEFVAGAFVRDREGDNVDLDGYRRAASEIASRGGTPVIFPSWGLHADGDDAWVSTLARIGTDFDRFIGFELGPMFVPYGRIVSIEAYAAMMEIPSCIGAKHSSLRRELEWQRLAVRATNRPDFLVLTGNDLAIDMVMYGSDYLLGLSTFAPDAFARRDQFWRDGDARFYELNDLLQYLGQFAFRAPVPAYRHDAAMFLNLRGWTNTAIVPDGVPKRPEHDREVLSEIWERLQTWL